MPKEGDGAVVSRMLNDNEDSWHQLFVMQPGNRIVPPRSV